MLTAFCWRTCLSLFVCPLELHRKFCTCCLPNLGLNVVPWLVNRPCYKVIEDCNHLSTVTDACCLLNIDNVTFPLLLILCCNLFWHREQVNKPVLHVLCINTINIATGMVLLMIWSFKLNVLYKKKLIWRWCYDMERMVLYASEKNQID